MLALHFDRFYQNPKDANCPVSSGPQVRIAEALAQLLVDLNHQTPRMLDGGPALTFHLLDVNRTGPSTDPLL